MTEADFKAFLAFLFKEPKAGKQILYYDGHLYERDYATKTTTDLGECSVDELPEPFNRIMKQAEK